MAVLCNEPIGLLCPFGDAQYHFDCPTFVGRRAAKTVIVVLGGRKDDCIIFAALMNAGVNMYSASLLRCAKTMVAAAQPTQRNRAILWINQGFGDCRRLGVLSRPGPQF